MSLAWRLRVAKVDPYGATHSRFADHTGSTQVITNAKGWVAHRAALTPRFQELYQRQRGRHGAGKATVALARKLAVIAYYRWRQALRGSAPLAEHRKSSGVLLG
jgi:hypothetical protein